MGPLLVRLLLLLLPLKVLLSLPLQGALFLHPQHLAGPRALGVVRVPRFAFLLLLEVAHIDDIVGHTAIGEGVAL
jgi:hypothetical protein